MYITFLLSVGILIGAGFVLALQWVLKKKDADKPFPFPDEIPAIRELDAQYDQFVTKEQQRLTYPYRPQR